MLLVGDMRKAINDDDPLTFTPLAAATANVVEWLRCEVARTDEDAEQTQRDEQNDGRGNDERAHVRSASMQHDDDGEDRNCEAERESDLHAGRKVVATAHGLKPFACLAM